MTREEAIECIEAIHVQMFNSGNSKWTKACDMAIEALKNIQVIDKIPQNYLYDTETEHCLVYRHKYTGKEIHILKPTDLLILERPHGEWKPDGTCSECGVYSSLNKNTAYFCPNCGAYMGANDRQVTGKLNSEIEKSKSEIVPDYRDGWRLKEGEAECQ